MTSRMRSIVVLIYAFVLLGMPGSALSVAWPSMADDLARSLGDLGIITLAMGLSYGAVSMASGRLTSRFPASKLLLAAAMSAAVSLAVFALADNWILIVAAAVPLGMAGGAIDSIGNGFVAVKEDSSVMGFIHAAFGFGSMIAPLVITGLVAIGLSWRVGFAVFALLELILAGGFFIVGSTIRMPMEGSNNKPRRTGSRSLLGLSVWTFFIYAGVEGSTGFWAFTLLTEGQGISDEVAGLAVAAHWGALFASRLLLGIVGDKVEPNRTVTIAAAGIVVGLALMWWNPSSVVSIFGLVFAGFANGPVFPLEVVLTAPRFGDEYTPWAVGYQLSAATFSIAIVPAIIGVAVNSSGALVIGAMLTVLALVMFASVEALRLVSRREAAAVGVDAA
ncbi:MAG: MFS transporter [Acidimicrobiia bacterium]